MTRQSNSSKRESDKREFYEIVSKFEVPIKESFAKIPEKKDSLLLEFDCIWTENWHKCKSLQRNVINFQKLPCKDLRSPTVVSQKPYQLQSGTS